MKSIKLLKPSNLDIDRIVDANRTNYIKHPLNKEKLLFICSSLLKARIRQRKLMIENKTPFANLCAGFIKNVVHDYNHYLDFLIASNVLHTDNHFIKGEKCTGYSFTEEYLDQPIEEIEVKNYILKKAIRRANQMSEFKKKKNTWGYYYLTKWLDCHKLDIDLTAADSWIDSYVAEKLVSLKSMCRINNNEPDISNLIATSHDFKQLVRMIKNGDYRYSFSGKGHRFYSPITNLKRELKNFLSFDGKQLVSIDLKNSQPYLSLIMLNFDFWGEKKEKKEVLMLKNINAEIYKNIKESNKYKGIITLLESRETLIDTPTGYENYQSLVLKGRFYEYIQEHFEPLYPDRFNNRGNTKVEVLRILFSEPNKACLRFYKPCLTFFEHFPLPYLLFTSIKKVQHNYLPLILQRIESFLVIDIICKKISELNAEIPLFTIHDNIITTLGNESLVEAVMSSELQKWVGYKPSLDVQRLSIHQVASNN